MKHQIITIFGATGFIGDHIVRVLARDGYRLRLVCSHPKKGDALKIHAAYIGQITPVPCGYDQKSITQVINGSDFVVNCTGILLERGLRSFMNTHCYLPEMIARACAKNNVQQFVHISALGVDVNQSAYAKSKLAGEKAIQKAFSNVTILRPSVVFGPRDNFFNMFAKMATVSPFLPLIGGGKTLFQPVYVGDVARSVSNALRIGALGVYELGGLDVCSFKELLQKMKSYTGQSAAFIPMPFWMARVQSVIMRPLPNPPLTWDQATSLHYDNIVGDTALSLSDLNVTPTSMGDILPQYLGRYNKTQS